MQLGFLGVGWIGRHRLESFVESRQGTVAAIADPSAEHRASAAKLAPDAALCDSLEELLAYPLDGIVIATPSALHADQAVMALERGVAVFCQKPLGRNGEETRRVVEAARTADRRLAVDFCYREVAAVRALHAMIQGGDLGPVYAADFVFHNAYGPDKSWYYDPQRSGGGCLVDLGIHLVDLALWLLGDTRVVHVSSRLFAKGKPLTGRSDDEVEDYAVAQIDLDNGAVVRIACSWNLPAGRDAVIEATVYGRDGGGSVRNVNGSFYDFVAERCTGTRCDRVVEPPDAWGGRALEAWAAALRQDRRFDREAERLIEVANVLDAMYAPQGSEAIACAS